MQIEKSSIGTDLAIANQAEFFAVLKKYQVLTGTEKVGGGGRRTLSGRDVFVAWVLIAGFLMQPVLAYLVTPILTHDIDGRQIVICTLKGEKTISIDLPQIAGEETEHCSALKLYQMASVAKISQPPAVPAVVLYAMQLVDQTARHGHHSLHFSAYSTRAPPIA